MFFQTSWELLIVSLKSFVVNIPLSLPANYVLQNSVAVRWRVIAGSLFSALMAMYYALSVVYLS